MNISFFCMGNKYFYFHIRVDIFTGTQIGTTFISKFIFLLVVSFRNFPCNQCYYPRWPSSRKMKSLQQYQGLNFNYKLTPPPLQPLKGGMKHVHYFMKARSLFDF